MRHIFIIIFFFINFHQFLDFYTNKLLSVPGHILLFKNFKTDKSIPEHIQIGARFKTEPYRIQYGTDPTIVVAEFRRKFQDKSKNFCINQFTNRM